MTTRSLNFPPHAVWIGSEHPFDLHEAYLNFRSPAGWFLATKPAEAQLFITADSRYKLWINGQFVARGPARGYPHAQQVDCLEVAAYLQAGVNTLAVQVYQPGYSHFAYLHRGAAGLLAHLICDEQSVLATDLNWRVQRDRSFAANVPRVSIYGTGVEDRDLNLAENWMATNYDAAKWAVPRLVAPVGGYPWTALHPRDVPLLQESAQPFRLLETLRGRYPIQHDNDAHLALRVGWFAAQKTELMADDADWFPVQLAEAESAYWLLDLGRDYAGQCWVEIEGANGQEQLSIGYQEKNRHGELVISDPQNYCRVRLTDRFRLRPGSQIAETFALRGGRYIILQLTGPTSGQLRLRPQMRISAYPLQIDRPLRSADAQLNAIIQLCEETFVACLQDGFVDCTWRESSQWLGDALPQSLMMAAISNDTRPLRQVIAMSAQGVYPDGVLPSVTPGEVHAYAVVDYNFTWIELLLLYWRLRNGAGVDDDLVQNIWPTLVTMLERFAQDVTADGLIASQPGRRLFLDWAPNSRREPNAIYNLRYLLGLLRAIELAQAVGEKEDDAARWRERATALQSAIQSAFWRNERWQDDLDGSTFSQLAAALALLTNTTPAAAMDGQLDALIARSLDLDDEAAPGKMVLASPFMHHYIFEALYQHNRTDAIIEIIRQRWGRWVKQGYPTTWENWNVDFPDGSQCHAFSAHPLYHLARIDQRIL
ncbi:MAG: alpha-L-rhamnosidase N-terminal domain-containing protein [Caldilineaceae bacterium]